MILDTDRLLRETFVAQVEHHPVLDSTNDRAKQCAAGPSGPLPLLIVADQQTAGRGRGANRWWTGRGSLAFSLLLDGRVICAEIGHGPLVSLAAAAAVSQAVTPQVPGHAVGIHWPNDVVAAGRKLAGVLVEGLPGRSYVVGVGVNLNNSLREGPVALQSTAVSLIDLTGQAQDPTEILIAILQRFATLLGRLPSEPGQISQIAHALCLQRGETLSIEAGNKVLRGLCTGIAPDGALLLDTEDGPARIVSGIVNKS